MTVSTPTGVVQPACPRDSESGPGGVQEPQGGRSGAAGPSRRLVVEHCPVAGVDRHRWDALAAVSPAATPFSAWAFQRAWWDAYGTNAHDETLVVRDPAAARGADLVAILPLMRRHVVEPGDEAVHTALRHGHASPLIAAPPAATALFMGASYHADYATLLAGPEDVADAARAVSEHLAGRSAGVSAPPALAPEGGSAAWDVIDLRRLRCDDPAADALIAALESVAADRDWAVTVEREDVCPVATIPADADFDGFLATLGKKDRHEVRRKLRRAEGEGEVRLDVSAHPLADLDAFIDLHQARWGDQGLFPATPGGDQSRRFVHRLFELFGADGPAHLTFLSVGGRRIASGFHFDAPDGLLFYNAGVDPAAGSLSPGVLLVASYVRLALAQGRHRLDFLRGDEDYKYEWGARDEVIRRVLVRRP